MPQRNVLGSGHFGTVIAFALHKGWEVEVEFLEERPQIAAKAVTISTGMAERCKFLPR